MPADPDTDDVVTVTQDGVTVEKSFTADEFPVPAVKFVVRSETDVPVDVRLIDEIPDSFEMEGVGFHPEYDGDGWTAYRDHRVEYERTLEPGEELTTVYGIRIDDPEEGARFLDEPELERVPEDDEPATPEEVLGRETTSSVRAAFAEGELADDSGAMAASDDAVAAVADDLEGGAADLDGPVDIEDAEGGLAGSGADGEDLDLDLSEPDEGGENVDLAEPDDGDGELDLPEPDEEGEPLDLEPDAGSEEAEVDLDLSEPDETTDEDLDLVEPDGDVEDGTEEAGADGDLDLADPGADDAEHADDGPDPRALASGLPSAAERGTGPERVEPTEEDGTETATGATDDGGAAEAAGESDTGAVLAALSSELRDGDVDEADLAVLRDHLASDAEAGVPRSVEVRIDRLQNRTEDLAAYTDALEAFIDEEGTAHEVLDEVRSDAAAIREDLDAVEAELSTAEDERAALEEETDALAATQADLVEDAADHDDRLMDVEASVGELEERVSTLDGGLDEVRSTIDAVAGDAETSVEDLRDTLDDVEATMADLEDEVEELQSFRERMRDAFGS